MQLLCRIHRVILAWCTAACTGVLCVKSTGRWGVTYLILQAWQWLLLTHRQFKRWALVRKRTLQLHQQSLPVKETPIPLKKTPIWSWRCSLCRIYQFCYVLEKNPSFSYISSFHQKINLCRIMRRSNRMQNLLLWDKTEPCGNVACHWHQLLSSVYTNFINSWFCLIVAVLVIISSSTSFILSLELVFLF